MQPIAPAASQERREGGEDGEKEIATCIDPGLDHRVAT